jgi:hypothetical protein
MVMAASSRLSLALYDMPCQPSATQSLPAQGSTLLSVCNSTATVGVRMPAVRLQAI